METRRERKTGTTKELLEAAAWLDQQLEASTDKLKARYLGQDCVSTQGPWRKRKAQIVDVQARDGRVQLLLHVYRNDIVRQGGEKPTGFLPKAAHWQLPCNVVLLNSLGVKV